MGTDLQTDLIPHHHLYVMHVITDFLTEASKLVKIPKQSEEFTQTGGSSKRRFPLKVIKKEEGGRGCSLLLKPPFSPNIIIRVIFGSND